MTDYENFGFKDLPDPDAFMTAAKMEAFGAHIFGQVTDFIPVINPKLAPYNCVGDGVTDDSTGFAAALAAAAGRILWVPNGTYILSTNFDFANQTSMLCESMEGVIFKVKNGTQITTGLFRIINRTGCHLSDFTIDLNKANIASLGVDTQQQGIYFVASTASGIVRCSVKRVCIKNGPRIGFYATNSLITQPLELTIEDLFLFDNTRQGALFTRPTRLKLIRPHAERNGDASSDQIQIGINGADGGSNIIVEDPTCLSGGRNGLTLVGVSKWSIGNPICSSNTGIGLAISENCRDGSIDNPQCHSNTGVNLAADPRTAGSPTIKEADITINGGVLSGSTSHGFYGNYADGVSVNGTVSRNNGDDGFKWIACVNCVARGIAKDNTGHGLSLVNGSGGGAANGGKNIMQIHLTGNGSADAIEDTAAVLSDVTLCTTD